jgi:hypothetical protein
MATLDWDVVTVEEVRFVHLLVSSESTARVRIDNCLAGPVWPPRRQGVPESGWDEDGFEGVVTADQPLALGYASPGDRTDPPAVLARVEPAAADGDETLTPTDVVRRYGRAGPPRAAVPTPDRGPAGRHADGDGRA